MKRIIALLIVIATCAMLLTGCTYNYAKRSSKYADVNKSDFVAKLKNFYTEKGVASGAVTDEKVDETIDKKLNPETASEDEEETEKIVFSFDTLLTVIFDPTDEEDQEKIKALAESDEKGELILAYAKALAEKNAKQTRRRRGRT